MTANKEASAKTPMPLKHVPYIRYPIQFQKGQLIRALIDSGSEVNAMTSAYATKLGLTTRKTSIRVQKIDGLPLETYGMASARFSIQDSL